jgi:fibronectin-binding autotransporter adhesin
MKTHHSVTEIKFQTETTIFSQTKRSTNMKASNNVSTIWRGMAAALLISIFTTFGMSQNLVVTGTGSFSGAGTINVKGNINTSGAGGAVSIPGTVNLNGTASTQQLGVSGANALTFATLNAVGSIAKQSDVNVTVTDALTVNITGALNLDIQATTLTLGGTSTLTTGSIDVTDGSSTVVYNSAGVSQVALGLTYVGNVTLSGVSTKTFSTTSSIAGAFTHSGGNVTIDQDITLSGNATFATVTDVTNGSNLAFSGTGTKTIGTVMTTTGTGTIENTGASGTLTISNLSANQGVITGGAGGVTFTNAAANSGTITGGAGTILFSSTLAQSGGTITAGSGDINFNGAVTRTGGSIASAAFANVLNFVGNVSGSGGTIDLTTNGAAEFGGTVASAAGLNFPTGTTVTYDQGTAGQAIADVDYGYLVLSNDTKTWLLGAARTINNDLTVSSGAASTISGSFDLNVTGNIALADNITKSANAIAFANASSAVSGTGFEITGAVTRTHAFVAATPYTFNNAAMVVTPTTIGTLSSFTMNSQPNTNPIGYVLGNSVKHTYTPSYTGAAFTATMQLAYLSGEYTGLLTTKLKQFESSILNANKLTGTYNRSTASGFSFVSLAGVTDGLMASGTQLALDDRFNTFTSIAATNWNVSTTWDLSDPSTPTATDDVVISGGFAVTIPTAVNAAAQSVQIDNGASGGLLLAGTGTLAVGTGGLTNNNSTGSGLTVPSGTSVTVTGGNLTNNGTVTNDGTITVE